ncbi:MAG: M14 family zinc carboxypeptidase [Bacillota bacterium]
MEDHGTYVKVNLGDRYGFVKKSDVTIQYTVGKNLVNPKVVYSYAQMSKDIEEIVAAYPGLATKQIIGQSVDSRNLYAVKLGKGSTEIMINGSHHARE